MKILELSLIGNKRLLNKGTRSIHYTPTSALQLIIGQNGHGKSTLLEELSPLPAIPANYNKGGSKQILIEHNTHIYTLTSDFTKGSSHSFLKDNTELNPGGTITVQKTLVEQEFGYTSDLHELLLGRVKITQLSTKARREWFVKLCVTDVSYATKVFGSLSQASRNAIGALKHAQTKLASEITQLLDASQHEELKERTNALMSEAFRLSSAKIPGVVFGDKEQTELRQIENRLVQLGNRLLDKKAHFGNGVGIPELQQQHESDRRALQEAEQHVTSLKREFDSVHDLVDQLMDTAAESQETLLEELTGLETRLSSIRTNLSYERLEDVELAISSATEVVDTLNDLLLVLPVNTDAELYTRQRVTDAAAQRDNIQKQIDRLKVQIEHAEHRCVEMKQGQEQSCPSCRYVWIPGFSESQFQDQQDLIIRNRANIATLSAELATLDDWLGKANEWRDHFVRYTQLTNAYPRLRPYWDSLVADYKLYNAPKSLIGTLERWLGELHKVREKTSIQARIGLINATLEKRKLLSGDSTDTLLQKRALLEKEIWEAGEKVDYLRIVANGSKAKLDLAIEVTQLQSQIHRLYEAAIDLKIRETTTLQNADLDQYGDGLRQQAGLLSARLQQSNAVIQIVEHLTKSIEELEQDLELYKVLLEELSPSTGLIADTLIGFVNAFTSQMNGVLEKIWTTPIHILPCDVSDGELDYQFPVRTIGTDVIADVSQGSTGEREIVDFAFRLIAMLYLRIEHYPLLLDEVGASFHELNRNTLFNYIKLLVECRRVSQVFVVSHFAQTHGSLTHADINIIDPTGIMVTPTANRYFRIQ